MCEKSKPAVKWALKCLHSIYPLSWKIKLCNLFTLNFNTNNKITENSVVWFITNFNYALFKARGEGSNILNNVLTHMKIELQNLRKAKYYKSAFKEIHW